MVMDHHGRRQQPKPVEAVQLGQFWRPLKPRLRGLTPPADKASSTIVAGCAIFARRTVERPMGKGRLEAFSDGVIAILITIMVLELKVPHGATFAALATLAPVFLSYVLSFIYLGIYWNNHHHMLMAVHGGVSGPILWANLHLLFWLSLIPFATAWMGENHFQQMPVALYGAALFMCGAAYTILARLLINHEGADSTLAKAFGRDIKGLISVAGYVAGIAASFVDPRISMALYVAVALLWLVPDRRIEKRIAK
jgi:uncharacterized membrane protein